MSVRTPRSRRAGIAAAAAASLLVHLLVLVGLPTARPSVKESVTPGPVVFIAGDRVPGAGRAVRAASLSGSAAGRFHESPLSQPETNPTAWDGRTTAVNSVEAAGPADGVSSRSARDRFITRLADRQTYPPRAREKGIEGNVALFVRLDPSGAAERVAVRRSSGSSLLDDAAVDLIRRSLPFSHGLETGFAMEITIAYRLTN